MENCDGLYPAVLLAVIGTVVFCRALREFREAGYRKRFPLSSWGSVAPGRVQGAGRAVGDASMTRVVLGAPCLMAWVKLPALSSRAEHRRGTCTSATYWKNKCSNFAESILR